MTKLRVLHVPFTFHPDPVGGTEIYTEDLVRALLRLGIAGAVAAPGGETRKYEYEGLEVFRYSGDTDTGTAVHYGDGDRVSAGLFAKILDEWKPTHVHFHALHFRVSVLHLLEAKKRGAAVLFTYHVPTVSCARETLMYMGTQPCPGKMEDTLCTRCRMESKGVPHAAAVLLSALPPVKIPDWKWIPSKAATALQMKTFIASKSRSFLRFMSGCDRIVAVSEWSRSLLLENGVPPEKLFFSRHGTSAETVRATERKRGGILRLVFLGRHAEVKGLHLLIGAIRSLPDLAVSLDIYGICQGPEDELCKNRAVRQAAGDPRIVFYPPVGHRGVAEKIASYDALAVPSIWMETGPLVVLEAFAAGVPVIANPLGGLKELIKRGENGWFVDTPDEAGWRKMLLELSKKWEFERALLRIKPPKRVEETAGEMLRLYNEVMEVKKAPD